MARKNNLQNEEYESFEVNIQDVTIDEYIQAAVLRYGCNVSIFRISPAFKDGLTPVKRRILFAMYKAGATYNGPRQKAAHLLGLVSAYHPHGNMSIEKAFVNEIKEYETNAVLFDTHGNCGSATGQGAAAIRYLDTKLSRFATMCFFHKDDYYEDLLDMTETYTRYMKEPVTLPSRYPYMLLSNITGVGWGNAFSSVPFNLTEVFQLTQALIKNPNMTNVYLYPDSPRGYDIFESDDIVNLCDEGKGTLKIQARIEYGEEIIQTKKSSKSKEEDDEDKKSKGKLIRYLTVTGLPEQTVMDAITQKISTMILNKDITGISTWEDKCYLNDDGSEHIEFRLILTPDADPNIIKDMLYRKTQLRHYLSLNLNFAARTSMKHLGVKECLLMWISNRISYKSKAIAKKAYKLKERMHVLEGIIEILSPGNLDTTIGIIRHAEDTEDATMKLVERYGVTSYQARCVATIRLSDLTRKAKDNYQKEMDELKIQIAELNNIIGNTDKIKEIICEELEEGIKLFGRPRACRVISAEMLKPVEFKYNIVVTKKYIKKMSVNAKSVGTLASDDEVVRTFTDVSESTPVFIIDDLGKTYCINLSKIKPTEPTARGNDLSNVAGLKGIPVAAFCGKSDLIENNPDISIVMFTESGIIKQSYLKNYITNRKELQGITLNKDDKVCHVMIYDHHDYKDEPYVLIYTEQGLGIAIDLQSIPYTERVSKGGNYLKLENGDIVKGVSDITEDRLFVVTSKGYGKICEMDDIFKTSKRRAAMIKLTGLSDDDKVLKIMPHTDGGKYVFVLQSGERIEVNKNDIITTTRVSKGKKMVPVKKGDSIIKIREVK